jgi:hypothetical protein
MITYNQLTDLRDKLLSSEIGLEHAKEIYWGDFKEGKRSWHTNDWKERRAHLIKDNCEICNSNEILTLQHLSHPKKYSDFATEIARANTKEYISVNPVIEKTELTNYIQDNYSYVPISMCPNCKSTKPNERIRKIPRYLCTICRHEFDDTVHRTSEELITLFFENEDATEVRDKCFVSIDKWKNQHNLSSIKYWMQRERAKKINKEAIEREALLNNINDTIKYLSFEDTITACKKCASYFDLHNMELCPNCKTHYKGVQYPTCIQCLPEEKRKIVLGKIDFGNQMRSIE